MFYRWLNAARTARHRRLLLQQKEEELKLTVVAGAWDKWRERYLDIRLQPMADAFLVQHQKNLVFQAFGIWHSKTKASSITARYVIVRLLIDAIVVSSCCSVPCLPSESKILEGLA